jgi:hypothetical protein
MSSSISRHIVALASLVVIPAAFVTMAGCASTEGVEEQQVVESPGQGGAVVDTFTYVATLTAMDPSTRKVTLMTPDGKSATFKADPAVNLSQFAVGDQIAVQATEAVAVAIRSGGTPASDPQSVALAAVGGDGSSKGVFVGSATEMAAKVVAIDTGSRKATFEFADGSTRTLKIPKSVDLSKHKVGETVVLGYAESLVIAVSRP